MKNDHEDEMTQNLMFLLLKLLPLLLALLLPLLRCSV